MTTTSPSRRAEGPSLGDADLRRAQLGPRVQRALPDEPREGQTGLSVAFDLPTQTGYDPDHPLARGEVGKVGVPVPHLGEMRRLFDRHPARRDEHLDDDQRHRDVAAGALPGGRRGAGARRRPRARTRGGARRLAGTTQNDIIKEYLSRGTYVFPPEHSLRLTGDLIAYTVNHIPKWNPINICSYHLQEAGATPTQELAYALCTAIAVLDTVRDSGQVAPEDFPTVVGRISFFVNAGVRFVEEMCKMRAFVRLWDEITRERYGVEDEKMRRFRYGVQVNSLGPDRGAAGEQRAADRAGDARRHAVQGRPRPRRPAAGVERGARPAPALGPAVVAAAAAGAGLRVRPAGVRRPLRGLARSSRPRSPSLVEGARAEMDRVQAMGGAVAAVESGYMKQALVSSHAARRAASSPARTWSSGSTASRPPSRRR